jgi:serine/threonine-protein kinase RsbW
MIKKQIKIANNIEELFNLNDEIENLFLMWKIPQQHQYNILLSVEEVFSNIVNYAFEDDQDYFIDISFSYDKNILTIEFSDPGKAFNPLIADTNNKLNKPFEERDLGGIGIHIVKSVMNEIYYQRKNDKNILILKKSIH